MSSGQSPATEPALRIPLTLLPGHMLPIQISLPSNTPPVLPAPDPLTDMPRHWRTDYADNVRPAYLRPILRGAFTTFCMIAYGHRTLEEQWRVLHETSAFLEEKRRLSSMVQTVNVVATLLLASTATFITTTPPKLGIIDYTRRGPYICLFASFGLLLGGIIVGCIVQFAFSSSTQRWVRDTLMKTRFRIWVLMLLLGYPFISIALAASVNILGLLVAAWSSDDCVVKIGSGFLLALPVSLLGLFIFSTRDFDAALDT
ncbi:hypothetical protein PENSPDRAFT_617775 [Peniophora sp. CONT]|nr:hypothetical protein PENSPDRAFT_617775 [Peniophora sp. CONT]